MLNKLTAKIKFDSKDLCRTFDQKCGTLTYMAPELVKDSMERSKPVDIWAIGILMATLLNDLKHPFLISSLSTKEMKKVIVSGEYNLDKINCTPHAKQL